MTTQQIILEFQQMDNDHRKVFMAILVDHVLGVSHLDVYDQYIAIFLVTHEQVKESYLHYKTL
jgi:hypothetical protein